MNKLVVRLCLSVILFGCFFNVNAIEKKTKLTIGLLSEYELFFSFKGSHKALAEWFKTYGLKRDIDVNTKFYRDSNKAYLDYMKNRVDFSFLSIDSFFKNKKNIEKITKSYNGISFTKKDDNKYCLLINKSGYVKDLTDIKGKKLLLLKGDKITYAWLDKRSLEINKKSIIKLLHKIEYKQKESTIVLNVYFNKADLGVVKESTWLTMNDLNPAIGNKVIVKECTKNLIVPFIALIHKNIDPIAETKLYKFLSRTSYSNDKEEFFNVLPFNHLFVINKRQIDNMRKFFKDYKRLRDKYE